MKSTPPQQIEQSSSMAPPTKPSIKEMCIPLNELMNACPQFYPQPTPYWACPTQNLEYPTPESIRSTPKRSLTHKRKVYRHSRSKPSSTPPTTNPFKYKSVYNQVRLSILRMPDFFPTFRFSHSFPPRIPDQTVYSLSPRPPFHD